MFKHIAHEEFWKAYRQAYRRKLAAWITGRDNQLLPYDAVRTELPFTGQRDLGVQTIPLDKIVGSVGRYRDFDRAFLPLQKQTSQRWINISVARYEDIELPAIEAYKIGDVYFVKDGNHRVSVARQRGQIGIDAHVIEIEIPIPLEPDMALDQIREKRTYAEFMQQTELNKLRPGADLELSLPHEYGRLLNHIDTHRYYLGLEQQNEVAWETAVLSWYDNVYLPLVEEIKKHNLPRKFPDRTVTDLYWWVSEYRWLLKESSIDEDLVAEKAVELEEVYTTQEIRQLLRKLQSAHWIEQSILEQEQAHFFAQTNIKTLRPDADIQLTLPGKYEKMLQHISDHRWYLGEHEGGVGYETAVLSWYDNVYLPIVNIIEKYGFLSQFPNRTVADLYLWTLDHREELQADLEELKQFTA